MLHGAFLNLIHLVLSVESNPFFAVAAAAAAAAAAVAVKVSVGSATPTFGPVAAVADAGRHFH